MILADLRPALSTLVALVLLFVVAIITRKLAQARHNASELARKNRELATLREITAAVSSAAPAEIVFARVFETLKRAVPVQAMAAVSFEEDPDGLAVLAFGGDVTLERRAFLDWLSLQRELESPFLPASPAPRIAQGAGRDLVLNPGLAYQVFLPLQTPALIAGVLVAESADAALVTPQTLQEMSVLADHLALSLQDRNLRRQMQAVNERLQGRAEMLQRILELSNELKTHLTLEHLVQSIVHAVSHSLGYRIVALSLYDPSENVFERRAQLGFDDALPGAPPRRVARDEVARWFGERYRISKSYFVSHLDRQASMDDSGRVDRRRRATAPGAWHPDDLLFVPLTAGDQLVGVLQVDQPRSGLVPRLEDVQALEIFANQAVTALQSARAYETTRQMSVRDSLTEAFNHRYFQETLSRELARHERSGQPLALVMLDIDDFKKINDRWGHPVGDVVLHGLVEELTKGVREMDTVARYGGEEFALIFPETTPAKAWVVADRIRNRVASRLFAAPHVEQALAVTISLGLSTYPEDGGTKRLLIERADQALYQAKRSGKNCLVTAGSLADLKTL
ncbi:MAG TPA: sensor domain-containing diguanylate cyclase [Thermoanaerobaculia bacterium]|nr:sensor domain-containing diguanylate cyclase [Thermoanaerobaculia bacterium]